MDRRTGPGGLPWRNAPAAVAVAAVASIAGITAAYTASMNPHVPGGISFGVTSDRSPVAGPYPARAATTTAVPSAGPSVPPTSTDPAGYPVTGILGLTERGGAFATAAPLPERLASTPSGTQAQDPARPAANSGSAPTTTGPSAVHPLVSVAGGSIGGSTSAPTTVVTTPTVASVPTAAMALPAPAATPTPTPTVTAPDATTATGTVSGNGKDGKGGGGGSKGHRGSVPPSVVSPDYPVVQAESSETSPTGSSIPTARPTGQKGR